MFGGIWIGFSVAAWICARKRDFANHRKFVISSFTIGLAFVWVRVLGAFDKQLFFIDSQEARDTTQEFLSFVIPLLVVELGARNSIGTATALMSAMGGKQARSRTLLIGTPIGANALNLRNLGGTNAP